MNLAALSAGAVATAKTMGFMKPVIGGNDGIWHEWDKTYQYVLVIYAERMTFDTLKDEIVFAMGEVLKLSFNSDNTVIIETDEDTQTMGLKAVVRFMERTTSKKTGKATHQFMSCLDGPCSRKNMTPEEK